MSETLLDARAFKYDSTTPLTGDHVITGELRHCTIHCSGNLRVVGKIDASVTIVADGDLIVDGNVGYNSNLTAASITAHDLTREVKLTSTKGHIHIHNTDHHATLISAGNIRLDNAELKLKATAQGGIHAKNIGSSAELTAGYIRAHDVGPYATLTSTEGSVEIHDASHQVTLNSAGGVHVNSSAPRLDVEAQGTITFKTRVGALSTMRGSNIVGGRAYENPLNSGIDGGEVGHGSTLVSTAGPITVGKMGVGVTCRSAASLFFASAGYLCDAIARDDIGFWDVGAVSTLTASAIHGGHVRNSSVLNAKGFMHVNDVDNDVVLRSGGNMQVDDLRSKSERGRNITIECQGTFGSHKPMRDDDGFVPKVPNPEPSAGEKIWAKVVHGPHGRPPINKGIYRKETKQGSYYWAPIAFLEDRGFACVLRNLMAKGVEPRTSTVNTRDGNVPAIILDNYTPLKAQSQAK